MKGFVFRSLFILIVLACGYTHAYDAIIFDCDGILVDTEKLKYQAWKAALSDNGITLEEAEYMPLVGHSSEYMAKQIQATHAKFDTTQVIRAKDQRYKQLQKAGVPVIKPGIYFLRQVISEKDHLQLKLGLASSAPRREILENLKQMQIDPEFFDVIISGKDDLNEFHDSQGVNKPKPYIYQKAAELLEVEPQDCLVLEDSGPGVLAASRAGMNVVAIPNQYTQDHDFTSAIQVMKFQQLSLHQLVK